MQPNAVKEKLQSGQVSVGTWVSLASSLSAEYLAHQGFDWIVVDTEHSPVDIETTLHCFQAIAGTGSVAMARVAWNDPVLIKRLLDAGALGLVVPMVNTVEEAKRAVSAMRYPPAGIRSKAGVRASTVYGADYPERANDEILAIIQIEHIDAVDRVEQILSVEGLDACFVGPNDLAGSMGVEVGDPAHEEAIQRTLAAAGSVGVAAGIHCPDSRAVNLRAQQGFQFVALASDARMLVARAQEELAKLQLLLPCEHPEWRSMALARQVRHGLDFEGDVFRQPRDLHGCPRGAVLAESFLVGSVDGAEVVQIGNVHCRLGDIGQAAAGGVEDGSQIADDPRCLLCRAARHKLPRIRVEGDLARDEQPLASAHSLRVRANGFGSR